MRVCLFVSFLTIICLALGACTSVGITGGPSGTSALSCLQCNIACRSDKSCPECKGNLKVTELARACPRCGKPCGRSCSVCGITSVPSIEYFKCPACGKTAPSSGGKIRRGISMSSLPVCKSCVVKMLPQVVPLRGCCPDCGIWSSRPAACPRCAIDMSPM